MVGLDYPEDRPPVESEYLRYYGRTKNPEKDNIIIVVVVEVDGVLYDIDNREETKESIRVRLVEIKIKKDREALHKQITVELNPKP